MNGSHTPEKSGCVWATELCSRDKRGGVHYAAAIAALLMDRPVEGVYRCGTPYHIGAALDKRCRIGSLHWLFDWPGFTMGPGFGGSRVNKWHPYTSEILPLLACVSIHIQHYY
jgi:hypothetical protein